MNKIYFITLSFLIQTIFIQGQAQTKPITGFTEQSAQEEQKTELKFDQFLNCDSIGKNIKILSSKPHHLGSPGDKEVAGYILNQYKSWGWDAKIETYKVLFPTPKIRLLEMVSPKNYKALLKEPALKEDKTSGQDGQLPTYNCWSADGDVTAELVFVNYGLPADYETLERFGIDVKGKIVIVKYGHCWRGTKPKVAQEHGATGCIIYSDPKEDGYYEGDVYPKGSFKNEYGVQRGSVMDIVIYPGDPLTPGVGAVENAKRLEHGQEPNLLKIPVLPISYHDAKPLLEALEGPVAPEDWRGALPVTYHIGPGKTKVHLKLEFDWKLVPCYDVIAKIYGSQYPDEWIIRGNHHDAWVNGANDPISAQAVLLEEAKAIGKMVKDGWKPKRSLVYCSWDGEEPGLIGSTEWVEDHEMELKQKAVAYINSDGNGRGFLFAAGSNAFEPMIYEISKEVDDPQTHVSVFERKKADDIVNAPTIKTKKDMMSKNDWTLEALGSGSDYSAFLHHLGIPSLNLGFGGENLGGEYHSIYDSYDFFCRFIDPGFHYALALSQTSGRAVLRLANADILPFNFQCLYKTVNNYVTELIELTNQMRESTALENKIILQNNYRLAADPTKNEKGPPLKSEVPYLDFSPLQNALSSLQKITDTLAVNLNKSLTSGVNHDSLNKFLFRAEQQLLTGEGLSRRNWYKHSLYAPGFYTGYAVKTLPGIREAMEQRNWKEAQEQINIDAEVLLNFSNYLQKIIFK